MTNLEIKFMETASSFFTRKKEINWDEVRINAAIAAMQGLVAGKWDVCGSPDLALTAVDYADALVEALQEDIAIRNKRLNK